jgi:tripartite-type tricarboxylate transporter receptor subunit TctC
MTDVVAGQVDIMFTGPPSAKAMSADGKLKILAVGGKQRLGWIPDVPTVDESGVPGYELTGWFGMAAPAKTPAPVLNRLTQEVRKAVADARFNERITTQGLEVVGSSPEEMTALMQVDTQKWAEVITKTGTRIAQ